MRGRLSSDSGEAAMEGPLGEDVRDLCNAGVALESAGLCEKAYSFQ
jgi:hypothetical protein